MYGLTMYEVKCAMTDVMLDKRMRETANLRSVAEAFAMLADKLDMVIKADCTETGYVINACADDPEVKPFIDELLGKK